MGFTQLIIAITDKHIGTGIKVHPPATPRQIAAFEDAIGFELPADFRELYSVCNGFECNEDLFGLIPLHEILEYKENYGADRFLFAEYMIYSDAWEVVIEDNGGYLIQNTAETTVVLTNSVEEFLTRFLLGKVFDESGLYEWREELEQSMRADQA